MRKLAIGLAAFLFIFSAIPANAGNGRDVYWRCKHGDRTACQQRHLSRECRYGNRGACHHKRLIRKCEHGHVGACERLSGRRY